MNENTTLFDVSKVTDKCVRETLEACIEALAEREWKIIETIITSITEESKKEKKEDK
jgi:uncharacterized protein (UPF0297 family)